MKARTILEKVKSGELSVEEAENYFERKPYEEMGFANLDTYREIRTGFSEVVYCAGKTKEQLLLIFEKLIEEDQEALGTRATQEQYEYVRTKIPEVQYDSLSGILKYEQKNKKKSGKIVICTGGTSDLPVAEEAAQTAEYFGSYVERLYDVGVSGIHRLLAHRRAFADASCIIAVAGMEGALPTVVAGLVSVPVIAVPTSVGYGASFHGLSALLTMINSCANGVAVVNIDNGYGAGYIATQINRLGVKDE